ncbi:MULTISPECIES: NUDIX domain-containing protein [unclassified Burkholderia]|nr:MULTISPECIES: NUDIX domain-containing protein [unclassified Burkholderia]KUY61051.1 NUDIX hydrolase [Burkholderia sp. RF2-non_BP3]KUY85970.1 NUDIX hydrolase [Burkholderia sp. RF4-BP95]KUY92844.1 NUDIX hydrolase [Burkholderia sp. RF7-non_BP4]KUY95353.1 NUDIX hydrolase [Burkholderia sp. RF7-non_BP1]
MVPVSVKAIIRRKQSVLFLRNPRGEWELPGGRPEMGESLEQALTREVQEECMLTVSRAHYVGSGSFEVIPGKFVLVACFECEFADCDVSLSDEHDDSAWIDFEKPRPMNLPLFYWKLCWNELS